VYTMLVDDEQWIVQGLAQILHKRAPDMDIRFFTDPLDALKSGREQMPDLLITDIRMPSMNGLDLIEQLRAMGLRFYAVLTGLDDIRLIQKSLRMQATDYLIKPVNKEELYRLIDHVRQQLSELSHRNKAQLCNALRLCAMYHEMDEQLTTLTATFKTVLIVRYSGSSPTLSPKLSQPFSVATELWHMGVCCWLYLGQQPKTAEMEAALIAEPGNQRFILSDYEPQTLHEQFLRVMNDAGELQDNAVALFCASPQRDADMAALLLKQLYASATPTATLEDFCKAVGKKLAYWQAVGITAHIAQTTPEELGAFLRGLPGIPSPHSPDVRMIMEWMQQHFREHLTLTQAAVNVYLQANYFTTLFKKETGLSFIQYLNELRVNEACRRIMEQPNASFEEAAEQSGFASVRYFFATFKKYTNQTPGEFRQLLQGSGLAR
jgi:AraC-like DNA-binding protein/FixJ family two-component response regulator